MGYACANRGWGLQAIDAGYKPHAHLAPNYEKELTSGGAVTERATYTIAGQMVAGRGGVFYYTYADHLGRVVAMTWSGGAVRDGSLARYEPFGRYPIAHLYPHLLESRRGSETPAHRRRPRSACHENIHTLLPWPGGRVAGGDIGRGCHCGPG